MSEEFDIQGNVVVNTGDAEAALQKLRDKQAAADKKSQADQLAVMSKAGTMAIVAGAALLAGVGVMTKDAASAETVQKGLATALKNTGQYSAATMAHIDDLTNSLRKQTGVSDEVQKSALAFASTMKLTEGQSEALLPLLMDMSSVTGMDLEQAFRASAQAMTGNVGLFQRYGVIIKKSADGTVDFNDVLKQLQVYAGQAAAKVSGLEGAGIKLKSALDELGESLGTTLIPELTKAIGGVGGLVEKFNDMPDAMKATITQSALAAGGILLVSGAALKTVVAIAALKTSIDTLTAGAGWAALLKLLGLAALPLTVGIAAVKGANSDAWAAEREKLLNAFNPTYGNNYQPPITTTPGISAAGMTRPDRTWTEGMQNALVLSNNRPTPTLAAAFTDEQITGNLDLQHQLYDASHSEKQQELHDLDLDVAAWKKADFDKVLITETSAARRAEIEKKYADKSVAANADLQHQLYDATHTEKQQALHDLDLEVAAWRKAGDSEVLIKLLSAARRADIEKGTASWSPINVSGVNVSGLSSYIGSLSGAVKVKKTELQLTLKIDGTSIKVDQSALSKLKETLGSLVFAKVMAALGGSSAFGG